MGTVREQIGDRRPKKKWVKKQMTKYWRRLNKQDPENAPTKRPIKGYD